MAHARISHRAFALPVLITFALASSACANSESTDPAPAEGEQVPSEDGLYAVFHTSLGDIVAELHYETVPVTVANFVGLAEGTRAWTDPNTGEEVTRPLYDGTIFHRVMKDFMIQGGDPMGTGMGGPGYRFADEFDPSLRHDGAGVLSMANSGPGTNGSQFFITHRATPWLDDKHSVFGKVVSGQDVVDLMPEQAQNAQNRPETDIVLENVEIVRRGSDAEAFDAEAVFARAEEIAAEKRRKAEEAAAAKLAEEAPVREERLLEAVDGATAGDIVTTDSGLQYIVVEEGTGASPERGDNIAAHYTGTLVDGTKFDSSYDRGQPFVFPVGMGRVVKGWDEAFLDMQVGEKRRLMVPPDLGYGPQGRGPIPPNSFMVFDVELVEIR